MYYESIESHCNVDAVPSSPRLSCFPSRACATVNWNAQVARDVMTGILHQGYYMEYARMLISRHFFCCSVARELRI